MMTKYTYFLLIPLLSLFSCEREVDFVEYEPQVVVEGRIENDQFESVLLSTSI